MSRASATHPTGFRARTISTQPRHENLLVAATGGHLLELSRLVSRMDLSGGSLWVTFDTPQSRSLLEGYDVTYVRHTAPRDWRSVMLNLLPARRLIRGHGVRNVLSTGSAVALSFLPQAQLLGCSVHYFESAARSVGPSVTGKALSMVAGLHLYTQYPGWADDRWRFAGSVFDDYAPVHRPAPEKPLRVFVSLGTQDFRFDRLVNAVRALAGPDVEITWQVGPTPYDELPGTVHDFLDHATYSAYMAQADVVISQAGVGAALTALEAGRHPILVARRQSEGEHVDDHQAMIGVELARRDLATLVAPEELGRACLLRAAQRGTERLATTRPIALERA